jgi:type VI secretion system protein ImpC
MAKSKESLLEGLFAQVKLPMPKAVPAPETFFKAEAADDQQKGAMIAAALRAFVEALERFANPVGYVDANLLDSLIAAIDARLQDQLDEILHHPKFQRLEAAWRGLHFLVDRTDFRKNYVRLEMIDISKEALAMSFEDAPELVQSGLYKIVYTGAYDTPGADPYGAMISTYEFENTASDIALLQEISKVSAAAHCPFIGAVGPEFFGKKSMAEWKTIQDLNALLSMADYVKWRSFRASEDARYVGLVFPRFLLRPPYGSETEPVKSFNYEENVKGPNHDKYLWGNAAFAFASNLVRAFVEDGWCVQIRGPQSGGMVENLPVYYYDVGKGKHMKIVTEAPIDEMLEFACASLGFIPFCHLQERNAACFFSANSVQNPALYDDNPEATANSKINARLPYILLASRFAHYLKVLQRENIGAIKDKGRIEKELNDWINRFVMKMKNPSDDQISKTPLNDAHVRVHDVEEKTGFYHVEIMIKPHFQIEGMDIRLSLVGKMPKGK